jgi:hypothetical protein
MSDVSMTPVVRHGVETCAGGGRAASGAARLGLAAAPTFAIMALWTGLFSGKPDMLCMAMQDSSPMSGMTLMYLLMSPVARPKNAMRRRWIGACCIPKRRFGRKFFGTGVEGLILELVVFGPVGNEAPLHHLGNALTINGSNGYEHRCRRRLIPIWLKVRRDRAWRELQSNFDFGVIGG